MTIEQNDGRAVGYPGRQNNLMSNFKTNDKGVNGIEVGVGGIAQKRRHLPIEGKKNVFNEWGAVLRHQDEVE